MRLLIELAVLALVVFGVLTVVFPHSLIIASVFVLSVIVLCLVSLANTVANNNEIKTFQEVTLPKILLDDLHLYGILKFRTEELSVYELSLCKRWFVEGDFMSAALLVERRLAADSPKTEISNLSQQVVSILFKKAIMLSENWNLYITFPANEPKDEWPKELDNE